VPWIVQTPEQRAGDSAGGRVETPVSLADLFPTLAGLAGVDAPADLDGVDLSTAVRTGEEPDRGPVFCDYLLDGERVHVPGVEYRLVRDGRYKYVGFHDAPELLFDLEADPLEQENLAPDATGDDREALERLRGLVAETLDFEAAFERRARDIERAFEERALDVPESTSGNAFMLPDGRVVDADTPLYEPDVLTDDPGETFADWPGDDD
jgi:choline-sulfatase